MSVCFVANAALLKHREWTERESLSTEKSSREAQQGAQGGNGALDSGCGRRDGEHQSEKREVLEAEATEMVMAWEKSRVILDFWLLQ